jgi:hypothetical protein
MEGKLACSVGKGIRLMLSFFSFSDMVMPKKEIILKCYHCCDKFYEIYHLVLKCYTSETQVLKVQVEEDIPRNFPQNNFCFDFLVPSLDMV